jgi:hypothetical protein
MVLSPSQFTIGQLVKLTFFCAIIFAMLRTSAAAYVVFWLPILPGILFERTKKGVGPGDRFLFRGLTFVGCGMAYSTYFYFFPDPMAVWLGGAAFSVDAMFLAASLWRIRGSPLTDADIQNPRMIRAARSFGGD